MVRRAIEQLTIGETLVLDDGTMVRRTSNNRYRVDRDGQRQFFGGARASVGFAVSLVVGFLTGEPPDLFCVDCAAARRRGTSYCNAHYREHHAAWQRANRAERKAGAEPPRPRNEGESVSQT